MNKVIRTFLVSLCLMIPAGVAIGGPNLTIDNPDFDFGFVPQHAKISHIFWLYSTGDSTLKITKIVPG